MPTTPDRPADQLRAAAERLRALLADLDDCRGPWYVVNREQRPYPQRIDNIGVPYVVASTTTDPSHPPTIADYICAMHPGVGLAVARWLASWAGVDLSEHGPMPEDAQHALAVARQLLGTSTGADTAAAALEPQDHPGVDLFAALQHAGLDVDEANARMYAYARMVLRQEKATAAEPAPADRAAHYREAAEVAVRAARACGDSETGQYAASVAAGIGRDLRRLAGEAAAGAHQTEQAHPPSVVYIAEVLELDGAWEYLGADADPAVATRRRDSVTRRYPDAETRTVRKTTTYTVEPTPAVPTTTGGTP
ncbi:hypothetical protein ACIFUY_06685 [Streptomyces sp. CACIS-1.16CA]|uniref:hypothetical protein n=1 Tax=Streptomyces sp. CACIS-1.16CA TaxID=1175510 RepID=UPI0037D0063E